MTDFRLAELKRVPLDILLVYKIPFGLIDINAENCFSVANSEHDTRGHSYEELTNCSLVDVLKYCFSQRILKLYGAVSQPQQQISVICDLFAV